MSPFIIAGLVVLSFLSVREFSSNPIEREAKAEVRVMERRLDPSGELAQSPQEQDDAPGNSAPTAVIQVDPPADVDLDGVNDPGAVIDPEPPPEGSVIGIPDPVIEEPTVIDDLEPDDDFGGGDDDLDDIGGGDDIEDIGDDDFENIDNDNFEDVGQEDTGVISDDPGGGFGPGSESDTFLGAPEAPEPEVPAPEAGDAAPVQ